MRRGLAGLGGLAEGGGTLAGARGYGGLAAEGGVPLAGARGYGAGDERVGRGAEFRLLALAATGAGGGRVRLLALAASGAGERKASTRSRS